MVAWKEEEEYETKGGRRRTWDDDFVLKRQFSALVPAFDPRPGRTNVQQTTDLEIPPPGTVGAVGRGYIFITLLAAVLLQYYFQSIIVYSIFYIYFFIFNLVEFNFLI